MRMAMPGKIVRPYSVNLRIEKDGAPWGVCMIIARIALNAYGMKNDKTPLELKQRARAEMYSAIDRVWKLAPERMRAVRIQITFTDGEIIGQRRQLSR